MASDTVRRAPSLGVGQGRGEAGGVPRWAQRLGCCWALSGRDLFKKSLGIIGLFGANRGELVYAGLMFEELRDALESLEVAPGGDALVELHRSSEKRRGGTECVRPCRSR